MAWDEAVVICDLLIYNNKHFLSTYFTAGTVIIIFTYIILWNSHNILRCLAFYRCGNQGSDFPDSRRARIWSRIVSCWSLYFLPDCANSIRTLTQSLTCVFFKTFCRLGMELGGVLGWEWSCYFILYMMIKKFNSFRTHRNFPILMASKCQITCSSREEVNVMGDAVVNEPWSWCWTGGSMNTWTP